jgi:hypothetical protein
MYTPIAGPGLSGMEHQDLPAPERLQDFEEARVLSSQADTWQLREKSSSTPLEHSVPEATWPWAPGVLLSIDQRAWAMRNAERRKAKAQTAV